MDSIGDRLKVAKKSLGLDNKQLADLIGCTTGQLNNWLNNYNRIPAEVLSLFLIKYGQISARWLITGQGAMYQVAPADPGGGLEDRINELQELYEDLQAQIDRLRAGTASAQLHGKKPSNDKK